MQVDLNIIKQLNSSLTADFLVSELNLAPDQVRLDNGKHSLRCPFHKELILHSLHLDDSQHQFKCAYPLCTGHKGGSFFDLYCALTQYPSDAAFLKLSSSLGFDIQSYKNAALSECNNLVNNGKDEEALDRFLNLSQLLPDDCEILEQSILIAEKLENKDIYIKQKFVLLNIYLRSENIKLIDTTIKDILFKSEYKLSIVHELIDLFHKNNQNELLITALRKILSSVSDKPEYLKVLLDVLSSLQPDNIEWLAPKSQLEINSGLIANAVITLRSMLLIQEKAKDFESYHQTLLHLKKLDPHNTEWKIAEIKYLSHQHKTNDIIEPLQAILKDYSDKDFDLLSDLLDLVVTDNSETIILQEIRLAFLLKGNKTEKALEVLKHLIDRSVVQSNHEATIKYLNSAITISPNNVDYREQLAQTLIISGDNKTALNELLFIANHYQSNNIFDHAIRIYKTILDLNPDYPDIHQKLAELLAKQNSAKEAIQHYLILFNKALSENKVSDAESLSKQIVQLDNSNISVLLSLSDLYNKNRDIEKEKSILLTSLDLLIKQSNITLARKVAYRLSKIDLTDKALYSSLSILEQHSPRLVVWQRRISDYYASNKKYKEAINILKTLADTNAGSVSIYTKLFNLYSEIKDNENTKSTGILLCDIFTQKNMLDRSLNVLQKLLPLFPDDLEILLKQADIVLSYEKTNIKTKTDSLKKVSSLLVKNNHITQAINYLEKLCGIIPNDIETHTLLSSLYYKTENIINTLHHLQKLFSLQIQADAIKDAFKTLNTILSLDKTNIDSWAQMVKLSRSLNEPQSEISALLNLAQLEQYKGKLTDAIGHYREILKIDPKHVIALGKLLALTNVPGRQAVYLRRLGDISAVKNEKEALIQYRSAQKILPSNISLYERVITVLEKNKVHPKEIIPIYQYCSDLYLEKQKIDKAQLLLNKIIALDANHIQARQHMIDITRPLISKQASKEEQSLFTKQLIGLANIYLSRKDAPKSTALLDEALRWAPDNKEIHELLAKIHVESNQIKEAIKNYLVLFNKALTSNSKDEIEKIGVEILVLDNSQELIYLELSKLYLSENKIEKVADILKRYLEYLLSQKNTVKAYSISKQLLKLLPEDIDALRQVINLEKSKPRIACHLRRLGNLYFKNKQYDRAATEYQSALEKVPNNLSLLSNLAIAMDKGNFQPFILKKVYKELAEANEQKGRYQYSLQAIDRLLQIEPDDLSLLEYKYSILKKLSDINPTDTSEISLKELGIKISSLYENNENYSAAIEVIEKLRETLPTHSDLFEILGSLYQKTGDNNKAVENYQKVYEVYNKQGNIQYAEIWAKKIIEADPRQIKSHLQLACLYRDTKAKAKQLNTLWELVLQLDKDSDIKNARLICKDILKIDIDYLDAAIYLVKTETNIHRKSVQLDRLAEIYKRLGNWGKVLDIYKGLLGSFPNSLSILYRLSESLELSKASTKEILSVYRLISERCIELKQFKTALLYTEKILENQPSDLSIHEIKLSILRNIFDDNPNETNKNQLIEYIKGLSQLYTQKKHTTRTIELLEEACQLNYEDLSCHESLALLYSNQNKAEDSIRHLIYLFTSYKQSGNIELTDKTGWRIIQADNTNPEHYQRLIKFYESVGNTSKYIQTLLDLAGVYKNNEDLASARKTAKSVLSIDSSNIAALNFLISFESNKARISTYYRRLSDIACTQKDWNQSEKHLKAALNLVPDNITLLLRLFNTYQELKIKPSLLIPLSESIFNNYKHKNDLSNSFKWSELLIQLDSNNLSYHQERLSIIRETEKDKSRLAAETAKLARLYLVQKQTKQALVLFEESCELVPDSQNLRLELADLYIKEKEIDKAFIHYQIIFDQVTAVQEYSKTIKYGKLLLTWKPESLQIIHAMADAYHAIKEAGPEIDYLLEASNLYQKEKDDQKRKAVCYRIRSIEPNHIAATLQLIDMSSSSARKAVYHRQCSRALISQNNFQDAISHLKSAIEQVPNNISLIESLLTLLGKIKASPKDIHQYLRLLADTHKSLGHLGEARKVYQTILNLFPDQKSIWEDILQIDHTLYSNNPTEQTQKEFISDLSAYHDLTSKKGDYARSIELLKQILVIDKTQVPLNIDIGQYYENIKDSKSAINHYLIAFDYYKEIKDIDSAIKVSGLIFRINPRSFSTYQVLSLLFHEKGDIGNEVSIKHQWAKNLTEAQDKEQKLKVLKSIIGLSPADVTALTSLLEMESGARKSVLYRRLSDIEFKSKNYDKSHTFISKALALLPNNHSLLTRSLELMKIQKLGANEIVKSLIHISNCLFNRGLFSEALKYINEALDYEPENIEILEQKLETSKHLTRDEQSKSSLVPQLQKLALIYHKNGNIEKALYQVKEALQIEPDNYTCHEYSSQWYLESGDKESAANEFRYLFKNTNNPGDINKKIAFGESCIAIIENDCDLLLSLTGLYHQTKNIKSEIATYYKLIQHTDIARKAINYCYRIICINPIEIKAYEKACELETLPHRKAVWMRRCGDIYRDTIKDASKAIDCYQKSRDLLPDNISLLQRCRVIYKETNNYEAYRKISVHLANVHQKTESWVNASSIYQSILELNADDYEILTLKVSADRRLLSQGMIKSQDITTDIERLVSNSVNNNDYDNALSYLEELCRYNPTNEHYLLEIADVLISANQSEKAPDYLWKAIRLIRDIQLSRSIKPILEKIVSLNQNDVLALEQLVFEYKQDGDKDSTIKTLLSLSALYGKSGQVKDADDALQQVLEIEPLNANAAVTLSKSYLQQNRIEDSINTLTTLADALLANRDLSHYLKILASILEISPNHIPTYQRIAHLYLNHNKPNDALKAFEKIIILHKEMGQYDDALTVTYEVVENYPDEIRFRLEAGRLLEQLNRKDEALKEFQTAGDYYLGNKSYQEAIPVLEYIIHSDRTAIDPRIKLATAFLETNKMDKAEPLLINIATLYEELEKWSDAVTYWKKAYEINPNNISILESLICAFFQEGPSEQDISYYLKLANTYLSNNEHSKARNILEEAIGIVPLNKDVQRLLLDVYYHQKDFAQAIKIALYVAKIYSDNNQYKEAEKILLEVLNKIPDSIEMHQALANLYIQTERPADVIREYREVARLYVSQNNFEKAIENLDMAIKINPNDMEIRHHLAKTYLDSGNKEKALTEYINIAEYYKRTSNADEALANYSRAADIDPENVDLRLMILEYARKYRPEEDLLDDYLLVAGLYFKQNDISRGWNICKDIFRIGPVDVSHHKLLLKYMVKCPPSLELARFYHRLCDFFSRSGDTQEALLAGEKGVQLDGSNLKTFEHLASGYLANGQKDKSLETYKKLVDIYKMKGDLENTLVTLKKILEVTPNDILMHQAYIDTFLEQGMEAELIDEYIALGDAYLYYNDFTNALSQYDKVFKIDPTNETAFSRMNKVQEAEIAKNNLSQIKTQIQKPEEKPQATTSAPVDNSVTSTLNDETSNTRTDSFYRTLSINPYHFAIRRRLIDLLMVRDMKKEALEQYIILIEKHLDKQQNDKALEAVMEALSYFPDSSNLQNLKDKLSS